MRIAVAYLTVASFLVGICPASAQKLSKAERIALEMTAEEAAKLVEVVDDPLDTKIKVSSAPFLQKHGMTEGDAYLRATIDRKSAQMSLELVASSNSHRNWFRPQRIVAEYLDGVEELKGSGVGSDVSCSRYGCSHWEAFAADVPEELLRWVARGPTGSVWRFKMFGADGTGKEGAMLPSEAAGFLIRLDTARASTAKRLAQP